MSSVHVQVDQDAVDQAKKLLAGVEGGMDKAVKEALSRAAAHLRANSVKAIRERYAISAANIRANENVQISYNYQNGPTAAVMFYGKKIPLYRYDGAAPAQPTKDTSKRTLAMVNGEYRWVHPGVAARGHQRKDTSPTQYHHAFTAQMPSGHIGIFQQKLNEKGETEVSRSGGDAIEELMGSSVPQMLGSPEVAEKLAKESMQKFEERLDHNVLAILSGYMR